VRPVHRAVLALVSVIVLAGCGGGHGAPLRPGAEANLTLSVRDTPQLGRFLVIDGWTLYMYPPDRQQRVTCTKADDCTEAWPPVFVGAGRSVVSGTGVHQALIGTMAGDGGRVLTYNHWPLYYYIGDHSAGEVNGQGQGFNWYVMAPSGVPNKTDMGSPTG
jgi:predicted lipoprotein with Yx(FWY)xxD motif